MGEDFYMSNMFMGISEDDILNIEKTIKSGFCDYKLKDCEFNTNTFEKGLDVTLIQSVADEEYELPFETKFEDGKYFITRSFEIIMDDLLYGRESRDVFQSVNDYFHNVIDNQDDDFEEEKESLVNFLILTEEYDAEKLKVDLDPSRIREDYKSDYDRIYGDDSLNRVQKSLALKELVHMSVCQVVDDIELFFTRPFDLTPEEEAEKNRQEAQSLENELKLS